MTPESESCSNQVLENHTKHVKLGLEASSLARPGFMKKQDSGEDRPLDNSFPEVLDQSQQWSMVSVSPRSGGMNFSTEFSPPNGEANMFHLSSPLKPPPIQTMDTPPGYDPTRIPSSIFSKPTTPTDWSAASNDSVFSIQLGNNSFSRDYAFMLGETKPEDWSNSPLHVTNGSEPKPIEYTNFTSNNLPLVSETSSGNNDKKTNDSPLPKTETLPEISVERDKEHVYDGVHMGSSLTVNASNLSDGSRYSPNPPRGSNGSAESYASFAFPLLVENGKSGRSSSPRMISSSTQANTEEEPPPPLPPPPPETQDQALDPPATKCTWFSCKMCWPGCCFKLC